MKKLGLALAAVTALGGSALAADMPVKAPPPAAIANWTGIYLNAGFGFGIWTANTTTLDTLGCIACVNEIQGGKGWLGVVGIGYDHQLTSRIVGGVFVDFNLSNLKGTIQDQFSFTAGEIKQTWSWAIGGRVGWLFAPQILTYLNAG